MNVVSSYPVFVYEVSSEVVFVVFFVCYKVLHLGYLYLLQYKVLYCVEYCICCLDQLLFMSFMWFLACVILFHVVMYIVGIVAQETDYLLDIALNSDELGSFFQSIFFY